MKPHSSGIAAILVLLTCQLAVGQKTDTIVLPNGDRITGEIKLLDRGRLDYSTDHLRRISVDWRQIVRIASDKYFDFELSNAKRYFGRLEESGKDGQMIIVSDTQRVYVQIRDVVRIEPLRSTFMGRLKGSTLTIGFDFTRANLQRVWNLDSKVKYRTKRWLVGLNGSFYVNTQDQTDRSRRYTATLAPQRFLSNAYTVFALSKVESNDELNLDLRLTGIVGASHFPVKTNRFSLETGIGLAATRERFNEGSFQNNLEGLLSAELSRFEFVVPRIDLTLGSTVYPSVTDFGRIRSNVSLSLSWEPISDYAIGLNGYLDWDSRPGEGASKVDYGIFSSFGISI